MMMAYVTYHNESFLFNWKDPIWEHYRLIKWWLLPHGLAGACALILGPMQFFDGFRKRHLKLHRVVGRIYVFGALVAGPLGWYIQYFEEGMGMPRSFTIVAGIQALLWAITTFVALVFALQRKITLHRQWMIRSYAVAIVFLEVRVVAGLLGVDNDPRKIEIVVWCCNAFALILADIVIHWKDLREKRVPLSRVATGD
jgi:uncharacterized membrane protein